MHVPDYFDLQLLAPRRILTGVGCRAALPGLLAEDGRRRPLVVSDPRLGDSAALRDVLPLLATAAGPVPMTSDLPGGYRQS